jgi:phosphoserine phosphatase RsbU/P
MCSRARFVEGAGEGKYPFRHDRGLQRLDPTGLAVGVLPDMDFNIEQTMLTPGDALLLYTDGITDALSPGQEQLTEPRLVEAATSPTPSAKMLIQNIMSARDPHIANREQYDDITLLAVRRK